MRVCPLLLATAAVVAAQDSELGAKVFRQSCAIGYCHGSGGAAGRAPKILGQNFDPDFVLKVTRDGIPNSAMPGWKDRLTPAELDAVVSYVVRISGGNPGASSTAAATAPAPEMPAEVRRGKELFFDAIRGTRCGTCHSLEGIGTPAGPNLAAGSYDVSAIRNGKPGQVRLARTRDGDSFPALLVEQKADAVLVYDLTVPPPVLRTFAKGELSWSGGAAWRHATETASYRDADLAAIASYLRWLSAR